MEKELLQRIELLEGQGSILEPDDRQRTAWNNDVRSFADRFYAKLPSGPAYTQSANTAEELRDFPIGEQPKDMAEILELLQNNMIDTSLNAASGFHFGYVPGGGLFATALGDYLAAVTNEYAGVFFASPAAVRMENRLLRWMCSMIGYPEGSLGNLTSGGSLANLVAITTARDYKGITAEKIPRAVIYLTAQVHHCVQKALRIAGLGEAVIRYIPMDERMQMKAADLRTRVEADREQGLTPFLLVGSAGTTDVGAIDPLDEMGKVAQEHSLWFHVDAAYGGFFMLVENLRHKFRGIELSDSVAIDPHKGFFLSYGLGAILVKNVDALYRSHYYRANYMQDAAAHTQELDPADLSPELTKHFRALRMWLALQLHGLKPFRATLEEKILLCRYFYERIQTMGFTVGPYPELSIMIFRYLPPEGDAGAFNEALVAYIHRDGRTFVSSTRIDGVFWIRMAVLSFRSHRKHVDLCLQILQEGVKTLLSGQT